MSSNNNVTVKEVTLTVLEIVEAGKGQSTKPVLVKLEKDKLIGYVESENEEPTPIYLGLMKYINDEGETKLIDVVEAVFSNDQGSAGDQGNVQLAVELEENNSFIAPFVTILPNDKTTMSTDYIKIEQKSGSPLHITFLEPQQGEYVAYPALYFHTKNGIIDPAIIVRRKPD
jgi:hypothetical protein